MKNEEKIKYIMDRFDFHRVHKTMEALGWTWYGEENSPEIDQLKSMARGLLESALARRNAYESCGGFIARKEDGALSLSFEVEGLEYYD